MERKITELNLSNAADKLKFSKDITAAMKDFKSGKYDAYAWLDWVKMASSPDGTKHGVQIAVIFKGYNWSLSSLIFTYNGVDCGQPICLCSMLFMNDGYITEIADDDGLTLDFLPDEQAYFIRKILNVSIQCFGDELKDIRFDEDSGIWYNVKTSKNVIERLSKERIAG